MLPDARPPGRVISVDVLRFALPHEVIIEAVNQLFSVLEVVCLAKASKN